MNKHVRRAVQTNARYQVIANGSRPVLRDGARHEDYTTKAAANHRIAELKSKGIGATLWDSLDNPLSNLFRF